MTTPNYRRACDLAEQVLEEVARTRPDWATIGTTAFRLGRIALLETLRLDRIKRG